jgi:methyl-accepting chemotaxis protein
MRPAPAHKEGSLKPKLFKQRYYMAKELQFSLALVIVLALLGGIFLQAVSSFLISYWEFETPFLGFFLILGYVAIVVLLAVFFTHRLVGPFKRLEYEMKLVSAGNLAKRLSIRSQDDLHIRNFVRHINSFISRFEEMSGEYNRLNSTVMTKLDMAADELSKGNADCARLKEEIEQLRKEVREFREKW